MKKITPLFIVFIIQLLFAQNMFAQTNKSIKISISLNGKTVTSYDSNGNPLTSYDTVCLGSAFNLSMKNISTTAPSGAVYQWSNIDSALTYNMQSINPTASGRWVATIKYYTNATATWTSATDTITISYYPSIPFLFVSAKGTPISGTNITVCGSDDSIVAASPGFKDYKWYKNSTSQLIDTTPVLVITPQLLGGNEGVISFFITAKDIYGCNVYTEKNIRRDVSVCINLGPDTTTCKGQPVTLSSPCSPGAGTLAYAYKWSTGATTGSITVNQPGAYILRITSLTKCVFKDTINIYQNPTPVIAITKDTSICYGTAVQLTSNVIIGNGPFTYTWAAASSLSSTTISNPIANPTGQGNYTYSVIAKDPIGCTGDTSTTVTVLPPNSNPYFSISANDTVICFKSALTLNPTIYSSYSSNYTWSWSPSTGLSNTSIQNPTVSLPSAGIQGYAVTATDSRGCKKTDSVKVNQLTPVTLTTNFTDSTACYQKIIQIEGLATGGSTTGSGYTYSFSPANGSISGNSMLATISQKSISYAVSAKDGKGCTSNTVAVTLNGYVPMLHVTNSHDTTGYKGTPMVLKATVGPNSRIQWYDVNSAQLVGTGPSYTTLVYAYVTDTIKGCSVSDTVNVTISEFNPYIIYVPNVFSPEAASPENQKLKVYGNKIQENGFNFRVYNQWGQLVYHTNSFTEANTTGWSGEAKGDVGTGQSNNVYTYTVEGKFYDGKGFNKAGTTTLLQ